MDFDDLTVLAEDGADKSGHVMWRCKCRCGNKCRVSTYDLRTRRIKRCGHQCALRRKRQRVRLCLFCRHKYPFTLKFFPRRKRRLFGLDTKCRRCVNRQSKISNKPERDALRLQVLSHYGPKGKLLCKCCGEDHEEFLTLDHIHGNGRAERASHGGTGLFRRLRRQGFPKGYRTLCMNCNFSLGIRGYCPHQKP